MPGRSLTCANSLLFMAMMVQLGLPLLVSNLLVMNLICHKKMEALKKLCAMSMLPFLRAAKKLIENLKSVVSVFAIRSIHSLKPIT